MSRGAASAAALLTDDAPPHTWLALWFAAAAALRGLVPPIPPSGAGRWWPAAAERLARASGSGLFTDPAVLSGARIREVLGRLGGAVAQAAGDPGLVGEAYARIGAGADRKAAGRYYTPADIAALAVADVVRPGQRVLDPACGGGRFLLAALDRLAPGPPGPARLEAARALLMGIDTDPTAVAVSRAALHLACVTSDYMGAPFESAVRLGDPLLGLAAARAGGLFGGPPGALCPPGGFDAVVGNPPYRAGRLRPLGEEEALLRRTFQAAEYQLDPYVLFLELALDQLRPGGRLALVVPDSWMCNLRAGALRRMLLGGARLERVVELPPGAFGAGVETVVVQARRGPPAPGEPVPVWALGRGGVLGRAGALRPDPADPAAPLPLARDGADAALLRASRAWTRCLGDVAEVTRGVNPYHHTTHRPEQIRARVHHADHRRDETFVPELRGRDIGPYRLAWGGDHWLSYGPWLKEPRDPRYFDGPRLVVRKILGETLCAVYLTGPFCADQSVYVARLRPGQPWPPEALLAFVGSRLVAALLRARHQEDDALFPQLKVGELRGLPLPPIAPDDPAVAAVAADARALQALETARFQALGRAAARAPAPEAEALRARIEAAVTALYRGDAGGPGGASP